MHASQLRAVARKLAHLQERHLDMVRKARALHTLGRDVELDALPEYAVRAAVPFRVHFPVPIARRARERETKSARE